MRIEGFDVTFGLWCSVCLVESVDAEDRDKCDRQRNELRVRLVTSFCLCICVKVELATSAAP